MPRDRRNARIVAMQPPPPRDVSAPAGAPLSGRRRPVTVTWVLRRWRCVAGQQTVCS